MMVTMTCLSSSRAMVPCLLGLRVSVDAMLLNIPPSYMNKKFAHIEGLIIYMSKWLYKFIGSAS